MSEQEKQKFIELFNRMLTGRKGYPVKLKNWIITFHDTKENAKNSIPANAIFDIWEFANNKLWSDPVFQAMLNLSNTELEGE
jgi:hypothetical protein